MYSQTVEYALRAMVALAFRYDDPMTVQQISEVARIPRPYLSKMMQNLARVDMVRSRRGLGGGFLLSRSPDEITVLDIINSVEPIRHTHTCTSDAGGHGMLCPLHRRLNEAVLATENVLQETTLGNIVSECSDPHLPCCSLPDAEHLDDAQKTQRN